MQEQERIFIRKAEKEHALLQEMPQEFSELWFQSFVLPSTQEKLFLQMERVYKNSQNTGAFAEFLTFEFATLEDLIEWDEENPNQKFVASDPSLAFFDGLDEEGRALFSLGYLDMKNSQFIPELELVIERVDNGMIIDFLDDQAPELWIQE